MKKVIYKLSLGDSRLQSDYTCFLVILAFEKTYRTDAYKRTFVMFVEVNHHHQAIVFGEPYW